MVLRGKSVRKSALLQPGCELKGLQRLCLEKEFGEGLSAYR